MSAAAEEREEPEAPEAHSHPELGEEAARLFAVGQDWAQRTFKADRPDAVAGDCSWCPLCQLLAVIRGERPEVAAKVLLAGNLLVEGLRTLLDGLTAAPTTAPAAGTAPGAEPEAPRVQRIDLGQD